MLVLEGALLVLSYACSHADQRADHPYVRFAACAPSLRLTTFYSPATSLLSMTGMASCLRSAITLEAISDGPSQSCVPLAQLLVNVDAVRTGRHRMESDYRRSRLHLDAIVLCRTTHRLVVERRWFILGMAHHAFDWRYLSLEQHPHRNLQLGRSRHQGRHHTPFQLLSILGSLPRQLAAGRAMRWSTYSHLCQSRSCFLCFTISLLVRFGSIGNDLGGRRRWR